MKILNVMDLNFNYLASIKGIESATIARDWESDATLELIIKKEILNADLITLDTIVWFDKEYNKAFIVEAITDTLEKGVSELNIRAKHINSLLGDYVTVPITGEYDTVSGTREVVARTWIDHNVINPVDTARKQYPIVLGELKGYGETVNEQSRFTSLNKELYRILSPEFLSFNLYLDIENKQFVFNVLRGIDRTIAAPNTSREEGRRDVSESNFNEGSLFKVSYQIDALKLDSLGDTVWNDFNDLTWLYLTE